MLRWLASISPLALLLAGAVPAGAVGWFSAHVKFEAFDRPAIVREATQRADDACTIRVMDAASRAAAAERDRQAEAGRVAIEALEEQAEARERLHVQKQTDLEQEIRNYEQTLMAERRACALDDRDLGWLLDGRAAPAN